MKIDLWLLLLMGVALWYVTACSFGWGPNGANVSIGAGEAVAEECKAIICTTTPDGAEVCEKKDCVTTRSTGSEPQSEGFWQTALAIIGAVAAAAQLGAF